MVEKFNISVSRIELQKGNITRLDVDAVVNAANTSLLGGGGVDGAIHRADGQAIMDERIQIRNRQGGCAVDEAVITTAGNLPAKFVYILLGLCGAKVIQERMLYYSMLTAIVCN